MSLRPREKAQHTKSIPCAAAKALALMAIVAPLGHVYAAANNSGRFVAPDQQGVWQAVGLDSAHKPGSVFYPSWYVGVDVTKSRWKADELKNKSTAAGLLVGNHFSPHLRWELRHSYNDPGIRYTGVDGERFLVSTLSLDYLVKQPYDGFSPVLRGGIGIADGDNYAHGQSDVEALLGLGMQWREDRWTIRLMAEQMGRDLSWGGMTVAAYLGGNEQATREIVMATPVAGAAAEPVLADMLAEAEVSALPAEHADAAAADNAAIDAAVSAGSAVPAPDVRTQSANCGRVFSTRVLNNIEFNDIDSADLDTRSKKQLAEIGMSYSRRSYIDVDVVVSAKQLDLALQRADSVVAALNTFGVLDDRIHSEAVRAETSLSLSMKDTRDCY